MPAVPRQRRRLAIPPPSRWPGLRARADHLADSMASPVRAYPPARACRVEAARPKGGAPELAWAGGGGPGGWRAAAAAAKASPEPSGREADGTAAAAGKAASAMIQARPSPDLRAHIRLRGGSARASEPSRRYLRRGRARVTAHQTSRPRLPPFSRKQTSFFTSPSRHKWAHPHPGIGKGAGGSAGHVVPKVGSGGCGCCAGLGAGKGFPRPWPRFCRAEMRPFLHVAVPPLPAEADAFTPASSPPLPLTVVGWRETWVAGLGLHLPPSTFGSSSLGPEVGAVGRAPTPVLWRWPARVRFSEGRGQKGLLLGACNYVVTDCRSAAG